MNLESLRKIVIIFVIAIASFHLFAKENDKPVVKGILFEGDVLDGSEFKRLADLPSKDELLAKLVSMLQSPMSKLVNTLNAPLTNVVNVLNNLKEQKT